MHLKCAIVFAIFAFSKAIKDLVVNKSCIYGYSKAVAFLNSTPLVEQMIGHMTKKKFYKNALTPCLITIPGSYLKRTLKRLRAAPIQKSLSKITFEKKALHEINNLTYTNHTSLLLSANTEKRHVRRKSNSKVITTIDGNYLTPIVADVNYVNELNEIRRPLSELEIKLDARLQKSMYRTTKRTTNYTLLKTTTISTPKILHSTLSSFLFSVPNLPPLNVKPFQASSTIVNNISSEKYEQLGCGFDIITQSCKDVFQIGWCHKCTDFGNIFLHECKCTIVTPLYLNTVTFLNAKSPIVINQTVLPSITGSSSISTFSRSSNIPSKNGDQFPIPYFQLQQSPLLQSQIPPLIPLSIPVTNGINIFNYSTTSVNDFSNNNIPTKNAYNHNLQKSSLNNKQNQQSYQKPSNIQTASASTAFINPLQPFSPTILQSLIV